MSEETTEAKPRWRRWLGKIRVHPVDHYTWELVIMRVLFALLVYDSIRWGNLFEEQPVPHGLARWFDFTFFADPEVMGPIRIATIVALVLYAIGIVPALALTWVLFVSVGVATLISSQGSIGHSTQLISMIILTQCLCYWLRPWYERRFQGSSGSRFTWLTWGRRSVENFAVHLSKTTIAAAYVVCGVIKLERSDFLWNWKSPLLSVQLLKSNYMHYVDHAPLETWSPPVLPIAQWIVDHPYLARIMFAGGLFIELFAFLALVGRWWAVAVGLAIVALHLSISVIMELHFDMHIKAALIFYINVPWLVFAAVRGMRKREGGL